MHVFSKSTCTVQINWYFIWFCQKNVLFSISSCEKFTCCSLCSGVFISFLSFFFFFCLRLLAKFAQLFFFCRSLCIRNKSMRGLEFSQSTMGLYVQVFCTFQAPSAISMFPLQHHPPPVFRPRYMCVPLPVWSMCFSLSTSLSVQIIIPVS